jgi:hypothetical protein
MVMRLLVTDVSEGPVTAIYRLGNLIDMSHISNATDSRSSLSHCDTSSAVRADSGSHVPPPPPYYYQHQNHEHEGDFKQKAVNPPKASAPVSSLLIKTLTDMRLPLVCPSHGTHAQRRQETLISKGSVVNVLTNSFVP